MTKRLARFVWYGSFLVWALLVPAYVLAFVSPGNPAGYVNDFASVLTSEQKNALENRLTAFNASTTNELSVVTVKNLGGDYIEHYATELFKAWGIGSKKNDNGALLLVAVDDRQMRIEVGYGLEGALTDSISSSIIRDDLTPAFKQNNFYGGIDAAVNSIIKATQGEYLPQKKEGSPWWQIVLVAVAMLTILLIWLFQKYFIFVIIGIFVFSALGQSRSWWLGGIFGALAGVVITFKELKGSFVEGGITIVALGLFGLLLDYILSRSYAKAKDLGTLPWWFPRAVKGGSGGTGSRGFGGGTSGGSSFGGFGGGSSGGGGASGRW